MNKTYRINEIFYSVQGEGIRAGTANVFVRFSGCNLNCSASDALSGFDCDTEFVSGRALALEALLAEIAGQAPKHTPVILTGGEPSLQIDQDLIDAFHDAGHYVAIETNGTRELPQLIDWTCVSPKSAEHTIVVKQADEVKYVRHAGQAIPRPSVAADNYLISPAFEADWSVTRDNLAHCVKLVKENPPWRLSLQLHKLIGVR
jgi:organic radical activating enzyme